MLSHTQSRERATRRSLVSHDGSSFGFDGRTFSSASSVGLNNSLVSSLAELSMSQGDMDIEDDY